jgi:hypothetical protein
MTARHAADRGGGYSKNAGGRRVRRSLDDGPVSEVTHGPGGQPQIVPYTDAARLSAKLLKHCTAKLLKHCTAKLLKHCTLKIRQDFLYGMLTTYADPIKHDVAGQPSDL